MSENKINICIIDDNIDICNILTEYFENIKDINVCSVSHDGENGLDSIIKYNPDIVLLDLIMPKLDGIYVLKQLKQLSLKAKVIMITAINHDPIAKEAFNLGSCYYMLKPFKLSILEERIRSIYNFHKIDNISNQMQKPISLETKVIKTVIDIGIPTNILGYQYIVDAIMMLMNSSTPLLIKDIYQIIADKNITTVACVESAMRNAILQAAKQNREDFIKMFSENNKRPTNSQFITKISQSIKVGL